MTKKPTPKVDAFALAVATGLSLATTYRLLKSGKLPKNRSSRKHWQDFMAKVNG